MATTNIQEVITFLETIAPGSLQESYDNSGLLTGNPTWNVTGILVTLDCLEQTVDEAIRLKCNLIVAHHPILFRGQKSLTGKTYVERTIIKAIKHDIALFAIHTNLDNVQAGVNKKIADRLGLINTRILDARRGTLLKLVTFIPAAAVEAVVDALHQAGAGDIGNYSHCSFRVTGTGTFLPGENAKPTVGSTGKLERVDEVRVEMILPAYREKAVLDTLQKAHPYEEVAYYMSKLENENQGVGAGMIGELPTPEEPMAFLQRLKKDMKTECVRYTALPAKQIKRVAVCGGAGSFLLPKAIAAGADAFVSADFKYHEFFDAEGKILIADIGHFESEQFTKALLAEVLKEKFRNFAVNFSETVTNPISYL